MTIRISRIKKLINEMDMLTENRAIDEEDSGDNSKDEHVWRALFVEGEYEHGGQREVWKKNTKVQTSFKRIYEKIQNGCYDGELMCVLNDKHNMKSHLVMLTTDGERFTDLCPERCKFVIRGSTLRDTGSEHMQCCNHGNGK